MATVEERVVDIVAEQLGVEKDKISRETSFVNDLVPIRWTPWNLVMELEEEFDISIPDEAAEKIQKVGEAVDFIENAQRRRRLIVSIDRQSINCIAAHDFSAIRPSGRLPISGRHFSWSARRTFDRRRANRLDHIDASRRAIHDDPRFIRQRVEAIFMLQGSHRRVVITGIGAVTPLALDVPTFWSKLIAGECRVSARSDHCWIPVKLQSSFRRRIPDFDARRRRRFQAKPNGLDRFTQFAVHAGDQAVADSGLDFDSLDRTRCGVILGIAASAA